VLYELGQLKQKLWYFSAFTQVGLRTVQIGCINIMVARLYQRTVAPKTFLHLYLAGVIEQVMTETLMLLYPLSYHKVLI